MSAVEISIPLSDEQPVEFRKKDGSVSKMRNHGGNRPSLPQNILCPHCPAKFTRTTHLNRHLRTHTNERLHRCDICQSQFTRSDLLNRHKKSCSDPNSRLRRKSCSACMESKVKCDREEPCSRCISRGKKCIYLPPARRSSGFVPSASTPDSLATDSASNRSTSTGPDSGSDSYQLYRKYSPPTISETYEQSAERLTSSFLPVDSHLSSIYAKDIFDPLFSNVFLPPQQESYPPVDIRYNTCSPTIFPFVDQVSPTPHLVPAEYSQTASSIAVGVTHMPPSDPSWALASMSSPEDDHYLYLFRTVFAAQIPIVHSTIFQDPYVSPVLTKAMQACGAVFVRTRQASQFVNKTLATARDFLMQEFAKDSNPLDELTYLIQAIVLLQTIGLFHQNEEERTSSRMSHSMLVMMVRRAGIIIQNSLWEPLEHNSSVPLEARWKDWILHETAKRAIWWSYMHDCCHSIYFATPPSYHPDEMRLFLPCDDSLWKATSSTEWYMSLQSSSPYGAAITRIKGLSMQRCVEVMSNMQELPSPLPLNPFSHFVIIHTILRRLFITCWEKTMSKKIGEPVDMVEEHVLRSQWALHNWLGSWKSSPETPHMFVAGEEPSFIMNVLPFYWVGQLSLLAYQENMAPFDQASMMSTAPDVRLRMIKHWLKHIRGFLRKGDQTPTTFWDELMRVRLQQLQQEIESGMDEDQDGLLGFLPEQ